MAHRNTDALILTLNKKAMDFLRTEDYKSSLFYLQKAEELLNSSQMENPKKLLGLTLNNFGCYYKRTQNLQIALNFLKKALEVETQPPVDINNLTGTHLNICAILSTMNDHSKALAHSLKALNLLKSKYLEDPSLLTTFIAAHHNTGVEYEHINQALEAEAIYKKGFKISLEHLGDTHPLTLSLKSSILNLKHKSTEIKPYPRSSPVNKSKTLLIKRNLSATRPPSKFRSKILSRIENVRFITGERLQPMFRNEEIHIQIPKSSTITNTESLLKDINGKESVSELNIDEELKSEEVQAEVQRVLNFSQSENQSETTEELKTQKGVRISIATQVQMFDSGYVWGMKDRAAIAIQKNIRRFLAKRKFEYLKYQKMLKDAERQAKNAKDKLRKLRGRKMVKPVVQVQFELLPIAYKDKLDSPVRTGNWIGKGNSRLTTIAEEDYGVSGKVVVIQKYYRGWKVRKTFWTWKRASVFIQKNVRRYQVQKLFLKIREAVIFIQRVWRRYLKKFKILRRSQLRTLSRKSKK